MMRYFKVHSKADMSQPNLWHDPTILTFSMSQNATKMYKQQSQKWQILL